MYGALSVERYPLNGGKECEFPPDRYLHCSKPCPSDCESLFCANTAYTIDSCASEGIMIGTVTREDLAIDFPDVCPGIFYFECVKQCKPDQLVKVSDWSNYEACNENEQRVRTRKVIHEGSGDCPALIDHLKCFPNECWVGPWSDWTCDPVTGKGQRTRAIVHDGLNCPELVEFQDCPVDCILDTCDNAQWSTCNNQGMQTAIIPINSPELNGGVPCLPDNASERQCQRPCLLDCILGTCGNAQWTTCDTQGFQYLIKPIITPALVGGSCPTEKDPARRCDLRTCHLVAPIGTLRT